jgi:hypothetical protein
MFFVEIILQLRIQVTLLIGGYKDIELMSLRRFAQYCNPNCVNIIGLWFGDYVIEVKLVTAIL